MTRQAYIVDVESTSLTADYGTGKGTIWELALIQYGAPDDPTFRRERMWRMKPDPAKADPVALQVGRYYERTKDMCADCKSPSCAYDLTQPPLSKGGKPEWSSPLAVAQYVAPLLAGATLVAAVPSFDATKFLAAFLSHHGESPEPWHYRIRDIGSLAFGHLHGLRHRYAGEGVPEIPPLDASTDDFARALGVDPEAFERHSALGDCRLVLAMMDVITGGSNACDLL